MISSINTMMTDIVHDSKGLDFVSINDSVLSSDVYDNLELRVKRSVHEYSIRNTDWRMFDILKRVPGIDSSTISTIHDVLVNKPEVTKRFYHEVATFDSLKHYGELSTKDFSWSRNFGLAQAILLKAFPSNKMDPIKFNSDLEIGDVFSSKSTSSGAIASGSKEHNWDKIVSTAHHIINSIYGGVPFNKIWLPAMPFHRSQLHDLSLNGEFNANYKEKDRLIWGVDAGTVLVEALFARPLIDYSKNMWFGYAGGKTPNELRSHINLSKRGRDYWYCTDYSKFDQTIPNWLIHSCFDFVRSCYDSRYRKIIDWIEYNFINTKILLPDGRIMQVHKGIPSGSHFTQLIGSMANALMMLTYLVSLEDHTLSDKDIVNRVLDNLQTSYPKGSQRMFVMGDDNLFFYKKEIDLKDLSQYVHHVFGVNINADKTVHGRNDNPYFLSRRWVNASGEDRDQLDLCLNLVLPERVRSYEGYTPEDILFSLFYTFRFAFHTDPNKVDQWFTNYFRSSGHKYTELGDLPNNELPGSAKVFSEEARKQMMDTAYLLSAS